jgi:2'-5' RNA ligase
MDGAGKCDHLRLFVACDPPREVETRVREWQRRLLAARPELRFAGALHVTLCFLGSVDEGRLPDVTAALHGLTIPALPSGLGDAFFLPQGARKRVVAVRVEDPSGGLVRLQRDMSAALAHKRVYEPERRPWLPHLTVARFRRPGAAFSLQNVNVETFGLPSVVLYSSVLEKDGAVHSPLATYPAG